MASSLVKSVVVILRAVVGDFRLVVSGMYKGQWLRGVRHGYGVRQSVSYELAIRFPTQSAFSAAAVNAVALPGVVEKEDDVVLRDRDLRIEESRGGFVLLARTTPLDRDSMSSSSHRRMVLDKHGKPSLRKTIVSVRRTFVVYLRRARMAGGGIMFSTCP